MVRRGKITSSLVMILGAALLTLGLGCSGADGKDGAPGQPGPEGPAGPAGPSGTDDPSVSAVLPGTAYLDRTIEVNISGYGTRWTDAVQVDFGPGVTVNGAIVASPTAIVASITIDPTADRGPRDVTIKDGETTVTYSGAFKVEAPLSIESLIGTTAQGSILFARASQRDLSTPFDTTTQGDGLFEPISYPFLSIEGPAGVSAQVDTAQPFGVDTLVFLDVNATEGEADLTVKSGIPGGETSSIAPAAFTVAPRTPTPLPADMPVTGMVTAPFASQLYVFNPPAEPKNVLIEASSTSMSASPAFVLLPKSGSFNDLISYDATAKFKTNSTDPYYIVYWDNSGAANYSFTLTFTATDPPEKEPNNTCAMAETKTLPVSLIDAELPDKTDEDWFAITATAADVGKVIHVVTSPGDDNTDTVVDVFADDCTTSLGGPSADLDYHEDFTSDPIPAAGTYYVQISHSQAYPHKGSLYNLDITIE